MKKHAHKILIFSLLAVIIGIVVFAIVRVNKWLNPVAVQTLTDDDYTDMQENYDFFLPYINPDTNYPEEQEIDTILIIGNDPFAVDADSKDGMAAMLAEKTGAEIINLAVDKTRISVSNADTPGIDMLGLFGPYFIAQKLVDKNANSDLYNNAETFMGDDYPKRADEVISLLQTVDMSKVDIVIFMYDMEDYFLQSPMIDRDDNYNLITVYGSLLSAHDLLSQQYPHLRFIYMSPFYCCQKTDDGTLIPLEGTDYDYAANYVYTEIDSARRTQSSIVDNFFNSINYENYDQYLADYHTPNQAGKELLINRLVSAINYKAPVH